MNIKETTAIMDVLRSAYPRFYVDISPAEMQKTAVLWQSMFSDDSFENVVMAVKSFISADTKGFPPVIGQIKEKIRLITEPQAMTEGEAWGLVANALRNSLYNSQEEFEKLPTDVRRIVGSSNQLREWAMMDLEEINSVVSSNFQRSYRARAKQQTDFNALPSDIKCFVGTLSERMALPPS